jgi:hypothetical protein
MGASTPQRRAEPKNHSLFSLSGPPKEPLKS